MAHCVSSSVEIVRHRDFELGNVKIQRRQLFQAILFD